MDEFEGTSYARLFDAEGNLIDFRVTKNFMTEVGYIHVAERLAFAPGETLMTHMGVGTGSGQDRDATALAAQLARPSLTSSYPVIDASPDYNVLVYEATFDGSVVGLITEAGIFNAASSGTMLNYWTYSPGINKESGTSLVLQLKLRVGSI